jgi:hypothetical protein
MMTGGGLLNLESVAISIVSAETTQAGNEPLAHPLLTAPDEEQA